jgi:hypothetical protein
MPNKNQAPSPADFFSGGGDLFKNLAAEEERKKLAAAKAAPQPPGTEKPGLPAARPSAPLSPVREVARAGAVPLNKQVQDRVDLAAPVTTSPLKDVTGRVVDFVRRKMTAEEAKQPIKGERDPEKLKKTREVYKEFTRGATGR